MWAELPFAAKLVATVIAVAVTAIVALPVIRRVLFQRVVRSLPPPVIKGDDGPPLKLPRRPPTTADEP